MDWMRMMLGWTDRREEARRLLREANRSLRAGRLDEAWANWEQLLEIGAELRDQRWVARAYNGFGNVCRARGDFSAAVDYFERSLRIARAERDSAGEGEVLGNLGWVYRELGRYTEAIECQLKSLAVAEASADKEDMAAIFDQLGSIYFALGQYHKALAYYEKALSLQEELGDLYLRGIILGNLGNLYHATGAVSTAADYYRQSLGIAREIEDLPGETSALLSLGSISLSERRFSEAIEYYEQALSLTKQLGDRASEAMVLSNLGSANQAKGDPRTAIRYASESLELARDTGNLLQVGNALGNLGVAYADLGDYQQSIDYQEQHVAQARQINDLKGEANALNNLGYSLRRSGQYRRAESVLLESIQVLEALREQLGEDDLRQVVLLAQQAGAYRNLQQVLVALGDPGGALAVSERSRARSLVARLADRLSDHPSEEGEASPPTVEQLKMIAKTHGSTIVEYSFVGDAIPSDSGVKLTRAELLIWAIQPTGALDFACQDVLPYVQPRLQAGSPPEQGGALRLQDIPPYVQPQLQVASQPQDMASRMPGLRFGAPEMGPTSPAAARATDDAEMRELYGLLIGPIEHLLPRDPVTPVVFVPDQSTMLVPFAALMDAAGKRLVEKHTISLAPSIQLLNLTRRDQERVRKQAKSGVLVVGNPEMPKLAAGPGQHPLQLAALPHAEEEAREVADLFNTTPLIGAQATKQKVAAALPEQRIIHLATHGMLEDVSELSIPGAIVLASSNGDDGLLRSDEIVKLQLNADLVVLSACETGAGRVTAEGIIGLSRAFILAGVPSIIVSLWPVRDAPTASLMISFYEHLQSGLGRAASLREAMLDAMEKYGTPEVWAPFVLIGET